LYDELTELARGVVVAHPGNLRLIFRSKRKNDRVDAKKLAKLLYLDEVPKVHVPDVDTRGWRQLIEFRRKEVDKRTRVKNGIRGLFRVQGVAIPREVRDLWTQEGRRWLAAFQFDNDPAQFQIEILLMQLDQADGVVATVTDRPTLPAGRGSARCRRFNPTDPNNSSCQSPRQTRPHAHTRRWV
jgi:transposase